MTNQYDWRFENSINYSKKYEETEGVIEHKYSPWRTNSILSNYVDTIMFVNQMNIYHSLDHKLQYDYLFHSIRPKKRFFKKKKAIVDPNFDLVKDYYKYNNERTREALSILTDEQIKMIKSRLEKGGIKNESSRKTNRSEDS